MSLKAQVSFKIPGKTFLLGEYLALYGGPSIVLTTAPFFEIHAHPGSGRHPFHAESPAGKYISYHQEFFKTWDLEFNDPYGAGGFGASTAQFIAAVLLYRHGEDLNRQNFFSTKKGIALETWDIYQDMFWSTALRPSGADLVAQMVGEICIFDGIYKKQETVVWPFRDKDVLLFKTSQKIPTHEHLSDLKLDAKALKKNLKPLVEKAVTALKNSDWSQWLDAQESFSRTLAHLRLVHSDTELLLQKISKIPGVLSARGCGALGADVIAVHSETDQTEAIVSELRDLKFMASLLKNQAYGPIIDVGIEAERGL